MPHPITQLAHVASCGWWRGDGDGGGGSIWEHSFTNHNLPHGRVVDKVVDRVE